MITYTNSQRYITQDKILFQGVCLSTDEKPTSDNVSNGSMLCEIDTSKLYFYDEAGKTWREFE